MPSNTISGAIHSNTHSSNSPPPLLSKSGLLGDRRISGDAVCRCECSWPWLPLDTPDMGEVTDSNPLSVSESESSSCR